MLTFDVKEWHNRVGPLVDGNPQTQPGDATAINALALEDMEQRLSDFSLAAAADTLENDQTVAASWTFEHELIVNEPAASDDRLHNLTNNAPSGHISAAHFFYGDNGSRSDGLAWTVCLDTAAAIPYRDFAIAKVHSDATVEDVFYLSHRGTDAVTCGIGYIPPRTDYRLSVSANDSETTMGAITARVVFGATGNPYSITDSGTGLDRWRIDNLLFMNPLKAKANTGSYDKVVATFADSDLGGQFEWRYANSSTLKLRFATGAQDIVQYEPGTRAYFYNKVEAGAGLLVSSSVATLSDGVNIVLGTTTGTKIGTATTQKLGFFNATPIVKPTVTGSRGANAALASLLTQLANLGLVVDSSS